MHLKVIIITYKHFYVYLKHCHKYTHIMLNDLCGPIWHIYYIYILYIFVEVEGIFSIN